jgi:hypothetical protein
MGQQAMAYLRKYFMSITSSLPRSFTLSPFRSLAPSFNLVPVNNNFVDYFFAVSALLSGLCVKHL